MENSGVFVLDFLAGAVGDVGRSDVARHNLFAKDVAIAFELATLSGAAVVAVEHAGIGLLVADGPYHFLQNQRRIGLLALHKGEYKILVVSVELSHIFDEAESLVVGVGEQSQSVGTSGDDGLFHIADALLLFVGRELNVVAIVFAFDSQHFGY